MSLPDAPPTPDSPCVHCGTRCGLGLVVEEGKPFCCRGCAVVYGILHQNDLGQFYALDQTPGIKPENPENTGDYAFLADPEIKRKLLDFSDGRISRVTFHVPQIHCVACVWLLERLFKLHDGIGQPEVNFTRRTVSIPFEEDKISLVELAGLLARLGYAPDLRLQDLSRKEGDAGRRLAWMRLGVAGFAFGNIMMLSFPSYLGLRSGPSGPLPHLFGLYSIALSIPVLLFSARDYFRNALLALRHRELNIDIPIAAGILALFLQSVHDILRGVGEGYLDSLSGLVFFLLIGKAFQRRSFDALSFDRDYTHYFPLAALRLDPVTGEATTVPLDRLAPGDRLRIRNGEIIPADSILIRGAALVDYSFVTGEAAPVERQPGDTLHAGGRHHGAPIEVDVVKEVSQGYLTSLWNHQSFRKENERRFDQMTQRASRIFIRAVLGIALLTGLAWLVIDPSQSLRILSSVLIVACPCALALSAPFAFGSALRILRGNGLYLKNGFVVEGMSRVRHIAFDKTGTLTRGGVGGARWHGESLDDATLAALRELAQASTHPLSRAIAGHLAHLPAAEPAPIALREHPGRGIEADWNGRHLRLGSRAWLVASGLKVPASSHPEAESWVAIGDRCVGCFRFEDAPREGVAEALPSLRGRYDLTVLTGDRAEGLRRLREWFPGCEDARPGLSPTDKLAAIDALRADGRAVMMIGDGLNDAGALRHADVGVAVAEDAQSFSPACDAILDADRVHLLPRFLRFSRLSVGVVRVCFGLSILYNTVGIGIAARGWLSPLVSAILMPLSSVSVLLVSVTGVSLAARLCGLSGGKDPAASPR